MTARACGPGATGQGRGRPDRRVTLAGIASIALGTAACSSGSGSTPSPAPRPGDASPSPDRDTPDRDTQLRAAAVNDERALLAACAGPAGVEPYATLRAVHAAHVRVLTGTAPTLPPNTSRAPAAPAQADLAEREWRAAIRRRTDCTRASPQLAPLLADLAASGAVAAALLGRPSARLR